MLSIATNNQEKMEKGKITIHRIDQFANRYRTINIFVDNTQVVKIKNNEIKTIELTSGEHIVAAKIDWCGSPDIHINIEGNKEIFLELGSVFLNNKSKKGVFSTKLIVQTLLVAMSLIWDGYMKTSYMFLIIALGIILWQTIEFYFSKDKTGSIFYLLTLLHHLHKQ